MKKFKKNRDKRKDERIAIIDIGSNSIRFVMYDQLGHYPYPIFDERVTAKLGDGLDKTGKMNATNIKVALEAIARFAKIFNSLNTNQIIIVATAAVRRAKNAQEFIKPAEKILNQKIKVITPEEEAFFMVNGLTNGIPKLTGLVVDLGGGSTEIALVKKGKLLNSTSLPIGHLSSVTSEKIREKLNEVSWLRSMTGQTLYGIGGSFRAIGKAYLEESNYPVKLLHRLNVNSESLHKIINKLENGVRVSGIPEGRLPTIGTAAFIIRHLFEATNCGDLVVSGTSIRDGLILSFQKDRYSGNDAINLVSEELSKENERVSGEGKKIYKFLRKVATSSAKSIVRKGDLQNIEGLIKIVCLLGNICWREPSENRGKIAFERVLSLPVYSLSHKERVWLATALFHRYEGIRTPLKTLTSAHEVLTNNEWKFALAIGLGIRFTSIFCAGNVDFLNDVKLSISEKELIISLKDDNLDLMDFHSKRRFKNFAQALGFQDKIELVS